MPDTSCLVCESGLIRLESVIGNEYRVRRCECCGFCWVDRSDLKNSPAQPDYDGYGYNQSILAAFERMKGHYVAGFRERVSRHFGECDLGDRAFLDIGCANGEYLWVAKHVGFGLVAGVEVDRSAAARAAAHGEVVERVGDLFHRSFDVVQIKNVLSNILDPVGFTLDCLTVLAPTGRLFLDVLNQDALSSTVRRVPRRDGPAGRYGPLRPPYVINGFTAGSVSALCQRVRLGLTWASTSYMGSALVPYGPSPAAKALGFVGSLVGRGSMLVTESVRMVKDDHGAN